MVSKLGLYILNNDNSVAPFPPEAEQIVLYDFVFDAQRMGGAPEITATIQAEGALENSLTTKVFCEYNGERYFLKNLPSSSKENTDPRYTFDLTFVSERTILDNVYMIDAVQGDSNIDRYQSNSTSIVFMGTIEELVARLNAAMTYAAIGYSVVLDEGITTESKLVSFQDKFFTEALQEGVNIYNIPYYFVGKVIHFGWSQTTIPTLKYGDGLLSINKSIRTERIINRATATGSSENIPYYYPNPTPKGYINPIITDKSGAGISVINEARLSRLDESQKLSYYEFDTVDVIDTYFSKDYSTAIPPYVPVFDWDKKNVNSCNLRPYNMSYLISGLSIKSTKNEITDITLNFHLSYQNPRTTNRDIKFKDVLVYQKYEDALIYDNTIPASIDGGGIITEGVASGENRVNASQDFNIQINNCPTNTEIYIAVIYYNNSSNTHEFKFGFQSNNYLASGWYVSDSNGRTSDSEVDVFNYGLSVSNTPKEGDEVSYSVIKKTPFATSLMPPIYRENNGAQRFYNAINGAYEGVTFENEYSKENPKEGITTFEDIKPTIVGVTNANGERIDMFAEFAYDLNDSDETEQTDESSESFIHPYFYAKLRKINGDNGFNLFAQAIESGEMTIEMTSGHCGACKFTIMVDSNTQRNLVLVDDNGNLIYDEVTGKVKMADDATGLDRQNDTQNYEVWVALKKDISTYGAVMPMANSTIQPSINDTFVITNILLPQAYFTAAEKKLKDEIIAFLAKNNTFQFEYDINFSRIFLKKRNDVFSKLTENSIIPIEYNGKKLSFYVSSYTYRKQKGEVLPEINVSLTDNFDSTPSAFQQSISAIQENVVKSISAVGLTLEDTDTRYLRKDVAGTVKERITFEKGLDFGGSLASKNFKKGDLAGAGFGVYTDENGNSVIEADRMVIRKDAQFSEIVINQTTFQLGATVFSGGGCNIAEVEEVDGAYRCYYDNKSGTRFSGFVVGDQARCQRFDESQKEVIKYYWRVVVAVGDNYVDLSTTDLDGTGVPEVGDDIVHFGNRTDATRQNAIVIASTPTPTILQYNGINSFRLPDPVTKISPDGNKFTGVVNIGAGSTGIENLEGLPDVIQDVVNAMDLDVDIDEFEFGKGNLLRNSGFTGDYLSKQLQSDSELNGDSELFSPTLEYWSTLHATAQESSESASGAEVAFGTNGLITQEIESNVIAGENYVLSFKAKGSSISVAFAGIRKDIPLTDEYKYYAVKAQAASNAKAVIFASYDATLCEPQLERGTVASTWGMSMMDNTSALAFYQSLQYIASAIKNGSTSILGGLILSNMLLLGNYANQEMKEVTAGVSGIYNNPDDVAFWAGGDNTSAITLVAKMRENPSYQPTDEEWNAMAKFVATHGGDVFMRGYVYALGGLFKGAVDIAGGKIKLNADGSGSLASGGYSWDAQGVTKKTYPDMIEWVDFADVVGDNNIISLDKGGYISNVSDNYGYTYTLPLANVGLSLCFAPPKTVTRQNRSITIYSTTPFKAFVKNDTAVYAGEMIKGNYLQINALTLDKYDINMTYDGEFWQINTQGTVGSTSGGNATKNITIWS